MEVLIILMCLANGALMFVNVMVLKTFLSAIRQMESNLFWKAMKKEEE